MAIPLIYVGLVGLGLLVAATALVFWNEILNWAQEALFPWVKTHFPTAEPYLREAFVQLDTLATAARRAARKAWGIVRSWLLKQVIEVERQSNGQFVRKVTSWMRRHLEDNDKVTNRVEEEEILFEDLPDDIRAAMLQRAETYEVDVLAARQEEFDALTYEVAT